MNVLMKNIDRAVAAIQAADGLLITAGAGMGVDSGLPDFRGNGKRPAKSSSQSLVIP